MLRGRFVNALSIKYNGNIFSLRMIASDKANLFVWSVLLVAKFLLYVSRGVLSSYLYTHIDTRRGRDDLMSSDVGCHRRYI